MSVDVLVVSVVVVCRRAGMVLKLECCIVEVGFVCRCRRI